MTKQNEVVIVPSVFFNVAESAAKFSSQLEVAEKWLSMEKGAVWDTAASAISLTLQTGDTQYLTAFLSIVQHNRSAAGVTLVNEMQRIMGQAATLSKTGKKWNATFRARAAEKLLATKEVDGIEAAKWEHDLKQAWDKLTTVSVRKKADKKSPEDLLTNALFAVMKEGNGDKLDTVIASCKKEAEELYAAWLAKKK